jgi:hypothetical protein
MTQGVEDSSRNYVPPAPSAKLPEMPAAERAIIERMGMKVVPFSPAQQTVDFHFNVSIDLTESLVGFRHDRPPRGLLYCELKDKRARNEGQRASQTYA